MTRPRLSFAALAVAGVLLTAAAARAQATVIVQVRTAEGEPGRATVVLSPQEGDGASHRCRAVDGRCRIPGVPAGRYVVTARPLGEGRPPIPRPVPIPPDGEVTVSVTLR